LHLISVHQMMIFNLTISQHLSIAILKYFSIAVLKYRDIEINALLPTIHGVK
jgi:hypothetical protein